MEIERRGIDIFPKVYTDKRSIHSLQGSKEIKKEGVSKSTPSFLYDKAPTFTSWGFVIP